MNRKIIADLGGFIQLRYGVKFEGNSEFITAFSTLVEHVDDAVLGEYFGLEKDSEEDRKWDQQMKFESSLSGKKMVDKILAMPRKDRKSIIDVGCGDNIYKEHFGVALIGIDPYNECADTMTSVETFNAKGAKFDIVMALGSINFGDEESIFAQLERVVYLCKPGGKIFLRFNPGITHTHDDAKWVDFFEWSPDNINEFAERLDCNVDCIEWDHKDEDIRWGNRHYTEWTKTARFREVKPT
jgi:hypothetical protein